MKPNHNKVRVEISDPQIALLNSRKSFKLDLAGQGAGKSVLIALDSGMMISKFPLANGFIAANTHEQLSTATLRQVLKWWEKLFGFTEYDKFNNLSGSYVIHKKPPPHFTRIEHFTKYENIISFRDGTVVYIGSLEKYRSHDGKEFTWAHLDETKDTKEAALTDVILGRLRQVGLCHDKSGKLFWETNITAAKEKGLTYWNPITIHTSPAIGIAEWINEMFDLNNFEDEIREQVYKKEDGFFHREFSNKAVVIYSTYHNKFNAPNYIENQIANNEKSPGKVDKLVFGLPFSKGGSTYYPHFERREIVRPTKFIPGLPIHITLDFNAVPYMTLLCNQISYVTRWIDKAKRKYDEWLPTLVPIEVMQIRLFREICEWQPFNSTEEVCEKFIEIFQDEEGLEIFYYGDASGLSRQPGLGSYTNFKKVESVLAKYIHNYSKRVRSTNVGVSSRRDLLNKLFAGKFPEVEFYIDDEECPLSIKDFEKLKQDKNGDKMKTMVENKETKEKYQELGHTSDAEEYFLCEILKQYMKA